MGAGNLFVANLSLARAVPTAIAVSSEVSPFLGSNADLIRSPKRVWTASAGPTQWLRYDLGSELSVYGVYVGFITLPTAATDFKIEGDTETSFTAPPLDETVTVADALHPFTRRYHWVVLPSSPPTCRYVRIFFGNGSTAPSVGQMVVLTSDGVTIPVRPPLQLAWQIPTIQNVFLGGAEERRKLGVRHQLVSFDWQWAYNYITRDGETALVESQHLHADPDEPVLMVKDTVNEKNYASLFWPQGGIAIDSPDGVGGRMPLAYKELV